MSQHEKSDHPAAQAPGAENWSEGEKPWRAATSRYAPASPPHPSPTQSESCSAAQWEDCSHA
jgi:hypothetical protein